MVMYLAVQRFPYLSWPKNHSIEWRHRSLSFTKLKSTDLNLTLRVENIWCLFRRQCWNDFPQNLGSWKELFLELVITWVE